MESLTVTAVNIIQALMLSLLIANTLPWKIRKLFAAAFVFAAMLIALAAMHIFDLSELLYTALSCGVVCVIIALVSSLKLKSKVYAVLFSVLITLISYLGVNAAFARFGSLQTIKENEPVVQIIATIFFSLFIICFILLAWICCTRQTGFNLKILLLLFPLLQLIMTFAVFLSAVSAESGKLMVIVIFASFVIGVFSNVFLLHIMQQYEIRFRAEEQLRAAEKIAELQMSQYIALEEKNTRMAKIRHDIKNHMAAINQMAASASPQAAQEIQALAKALSDQLKAETAPQGLEVNL